MFNISLHGDVELVSALEAMPGSVRDMLAVEMEGIVIKLREHVVGDKLSGQVLHQITGNLARSIKEEGPLIDGDTVKGIVYSDGSVKYAGVHEYGLTVERVSSLGNTFSVTYPERSFLRSSLGDQHDDIVIRLKRAAMRGFATVKGPSA